MDPISIAMALAQFAPGIIKLLTGSDKAADVAGKVIDVAKVVTGKGDGAAAVTAIQLDPAKAVEFQLAMGAQQLDLERMYLVDTQNARALQVAALAQEDIFSKRFVYYFAAAWSVFSMVYFMAVTFFPPPADGVRIADTILGVLIASVIGVMFAYFYGTNRDSKKKDDTINKLSGS
jgi:hypothetical protein